MLTEEQILQALSVVRDPDLKKTIVELGFVHNVKICADGDVTLDLQLTTPACPIRDRFKTQCEQILRDIGAKTAEVTLTANGRVVNANAAPASDNALLKDVKRIVGVASGKDGSQFSGRKSRRFGRRHLRSFDEYYVRGGYRSRNF